MKIKNSCKNKSQLVQNIIRNQSIDSNSFLPTSQSMDKQTFTKKYVSVSNYSLLNMEINTCMQSPPFNSSFDTNSRSGVVQTTDAVAALHPKVVQTLLKLSPISQQKPHKKKFMSRISTYDKRNLYAKSRGDIRTGIEFFKIKFF